MWKQLMKMASEELSEQQLGMMDMAKKIAEESGIDMVGDSIVLYHGTRQGDKIRKGGKWRIGTFFSNGENTALKYARQAQVGRKMEVMKVLVPMYALFPHGKEDGNWFFTLNEEVPVVGA